MCFVWHRERARARKIVALKIINTNQYDSDSRTTRLLRSILLLNLLIILLVFCVLLVIRITLRKAAKIICNQNTRVKKSVKVN